MAALQAEPLGPPPAQSLTARQVEVFMLVSRYCENLGQACPARYVAKQLDIHHEAVRTHFATLCRKGWLASASSPATPARWLPRYVVNR